MTGSTCRLGLSIDAFRTAAELVGFTGFASSLSTVPEVEVLNPARMRSRVDLPAPFSPTMT